MSALSILFIITTSILVFYLIFPFASFLFSLLYKDKKSITNTSLENDIAIIVTAYKNILITQPLIKSFLLQNYSNYHIYIVCDRCLMKQELLQDEKITYLFPENPLDSKTGSIRYAIDSFLRKHEYIMIMDPDNLASGELLNITNRYLNHNTKAIQIKRVAKNSDSKFSILDGINEQYYNYSQRYVPSVLGSSASISGSGIIVHNQILTSFLDHIHETYGNKLIIAEDKILQIYLVKNKFKIGFITETIVYDEKVNSGTQLERQRTRWLNSYFRHLFDSFKLLLTGIIKFNFNMIYFSVMIMNPPIIVLFASSILLIILSSFINIMLSYVLLIAGVLFTFYFIYAVKQSNIGIFSFTFLKDIPSFIFIQLKAIIKIKLANKDFLVTENNSIIEIEKLETSNAKD